MNISLLWSRLSVQILIDKASVVIVRLYAYDLGLLLTSLVYVCNRVVQKKLFFQI